MKTKEERNAIKEEAEAVSGELRHLTEEELAQVTGGNDADNRINVPLFYKIIGSIAEMFGISEHTQSAFGGADGAPSAPIPSNGEGGIPRPGDINGRK